MATSISSRNLSGLLAFITCFVGSLHAQEIPPPAYQLAAQAAEIPAEVLYAVALTESGLRIADKVRPWPWTLNVAGRGRFFKSRVDACEALTKTLQTTSAKRVDVGLAQINYGYHAKRVTAPCDLLDPTINLKIAADLLKQHYRPNESWLMAMGRYHRPAGGSPAARYRQAANKHLVRISQN